MKAELFLSLNTQFDCYCNCCFCVVLCGLNTLSAPIRNREANKWGLPIRNVQSCTRTHVDKSTMRMECIYKNTEDNLNQNGHFLCACESRCLLHAAMFASDFHFIVFVRLWIFSIAICAKIKNEEIWHLSMCDNDFWKFLLREKKIWVKYSKYPYVLVQISHPILLQNLVGFIIELNKKLKLRGKVLFTLKCDK